MTETKSPDLWAIVEIYGHQRLAGRISEQTIGGCSFVRIDVPALPTRVLNRYGRTETQPSLAGFTKLYGNGAIFSVSFVDEVVATAAAAEMRVQPIDAYTLGDAIRAMDRSELDAILERSKTPRLENFGANED